MQSWHEKHKESLTTSDRIADRISAVIGSANYIIAQTVLIILWLIYNGFTFFSVKLGWSSFDPYPFIFLNLVFSILAAFATPFILISEKRQSGRDRAHAEHDLEVNMRAEREIQKSIELARQNQEMLKEIKEQLIKNNHTVK